MILGLLCEETMRIESLIQVIQPLSVRGEVEADVKGLAYDSRYVKPGCLFVALKGRHQDGARFIQEAVERGAVAVVSETPGWARKDVAHVQVEDARRALAEIACAFYEHPSSRLETFGVTGTNGKTTTTYMIRDMLKAAGRSPGLIGTVSYEIGARSIPANRTTPEAPDLQNMLDQMTRAGCRSAVMEVSSHALDQRRVWGIDFDVGVFTNLTQDHLDYHETMEQYFTAKMRLFRGLGQMQKAAVAVINLDDPWGQQLANVCSWAECLTYGVHPGASVRAEDLSVGAEGSAFRLVTPWGEAPVRLTTLGRFNVSNALAAAAACGARGVPLETIVRALATFVAAPGRLETIPNDRGIQVFVDYAHTDDALFNVLTTLREITAGRLILLFGCGGDRDATKRPKMGAVAARLADCTILTNDNPRTEDPKKIIEDIRQGFQGHEAAAEAVEDREEAIARALSIAQPGDTVLIAGKGHENYQEFQHTVVPFDDREVARRLLRHG